MKTTVHARVSRDERAAIERLKAVTGQTESDLVRRGLALVEREVTAAPSALDRAGDSVGRFRNGPADLSMNPDHLDGFGR
ncbi:MAG TPA: hypothetical protein VHD57_19015 [Vicinamibacterales bacterium]|jgi:hypothetical protein|nr:hypothetical protein [Vicinamibacterales bacterium]